MKIKRYSDVPGCPVEVTLDLIDGRWKGVVLFHLIEANCLRFNELHRRVRGITQRHEDRRNRTNRFVPNIH
jgi:DNA-binding HxlR family transcriptional regulator